MNTFGSRFRFTSFGESHGPAMGGVIDGCPHGLKIDETFIADNLQRRMLGDGKETTARHEPDKVEWLSGLLNGETTGTSLAFLIHNKDARSEDYDNLHYMLRPGHGEGGYLAKYGIFDHRGGGRNSGRITAPWVVAGSIAQLVLRKRFPLSVRAQTQKRGMVECECHISENGEGFPMMAGLGEPSFHSLKAVLAQAMMSIPSAVAFDMGIGREAIEMTGEEYSDPWDPKRPFHTLTNHCGGVQGGISNGMPLAFRVYFHPPVTHSGTTQCLDYMTKKIKAVEVHGRHDTDHTSRCVPVVESMAAIVLLDFILQDNLDL